MKAEVEFFGVTKRYGTAVAVENISFRIEPGTLVTLLGPSGCGKTTTLRMIAGLELASEGRIVIGGEDVTKLPATERDVTMVFQSYALFPHMSVLENVAYGLNASRRKKRGAMETAGAALALVGLAGYGNRLPSELSGGQQQRVAVARALVLEPKVLLLDEPLSNLDAKLRRKMREDIRELQQKLGVTAVYVTHDQEEALSVSDKIIVMDRAKIVQEGTPRDLYEAPRSEFIARFIGEANLVRGTLRRLDAQKGSVELNGLTVELPHRNLADGPVIIAIRSHAIIIAKKGKGVPATVKKTVYLGSHFEYALATKLGELFATGTTRVDQDEEVVINFDPAGLALVGA